ncbi:DUF3307 domain-containing protein [Patescibacteria group bacterium]|nr:DUF3307 domain-containing protein [Patescibacteria group bacterium]
MHLLIYFYLIHFLADYPLQPNALIAMKKKGYFGVLLHCLVHLAVLIAVLSPFLHLKSVWIGITIVFLTHNIIDQTKITIDKKYPKKSLLFYVSDQLLHLTIITLIAFNIGYIKPNISLEKLGLYADHNFVTYILALILVTYFYDVTRYFIQTRKKKMVYKRNYSTMIWNAFIVSIGFAMYWVAF